MIRLEVRCPPPQNAAGPRSGSLVIDVHDIQFSPGAHFENKKSTARFTEDFVQGRPNVQAPSGGINPLFWLELGRVVVAYAFSGETKANMIVSVGPFPSSQTSKLASSQFGTRPSSMETVSSAPSRFPSIIVSQTSRSRFSSDSPRPFGTVVAVDVPCVYANLTKPLVDGLQLWADDMTQLLDRIFWEQSKDCDMDNPNSRNSSILGSRFFVKSRSGSGSETASSLNNDHVGETILKISVSEGTRFNSYQ
jgi:autophagy-related protein 2